MERGSVCGGKDGRFGVQLSSYSFWGTFAILLKSDYEHLHVCPSAWNNSSPTGRSFIKFEYFPKICREKIKFHLNQTRLKGTLHEERNTFLIISLSVPKMRNVTDRSVERTETHPYCMFYFFFFRKSCRLWDNVEKYCRYGQALHAGCLSKKHTVTICNTCMYTPTMVSRTLLYVAQYVHSLLLPVTLYWTFLSAARDSCGFNISKSGRQYREINPPVLRPFVLSLFF